MAVFWVVVQCYLIDVGKLLPDYTAQQSRRQPSSYSPSWELEISLGVSYVCEIWQAGNSYTVTAYSVYERLNCNDLILCWKRQQCSTVDTHFPTRLLFLWWFHASACSQRVYCLEKIPENKRKLLDCKNKVQAKKLQFWPRTKWSLCSWSYCFYILWLTFIKPRCP
jgi:hypothetical protein